ncbi:MAG: hypothetical protein KF773_35245 [Deltaproteobacteria bacterium]|nr:hypothetical protein [Deltaproteobacteria bacterium]
MGAALVLLLVGLGAMAAGVLIGRYYVPDDRQLRRTARHSKAYMRALSHLIARDHDTVVSELRTVVEENVDDVEPYFALGAMFRSRGENERAIRVHQALALRERDKRKLRQRAMYELGLDFRGAGMPRRATRAMEQVLLEEPGHEGALRVLASLYEEQARFNEAADLWHRIGKRRDEDTTLREHHLLVAAAQAALAREDLDSAKQLLKAAQKHHETAHFFAAAAELAAARGNHRGARERLRQALVAEPALVPHLLPGLIAAETGIAGTEKGRDSRRAHDDLDDAEPLARATPPGGIPIQPDPTLALPEPSPPPPDLSDLVAAASAAAGVPADALAATSSGVVRTGDALASGATSSGVVRTSDATSSGVRTGDATGVLRGDAVSPALRGDATGSGVRTGDATGSGIRGDAMSSGVRAGDATDSGVRPGDATASGVRAGDATASGVRSGVRAGDATSSGSALVRVGSGTTALASGVLRAGDATSSGVRPPEGFALVPSHKPAGTVAERVLALLAEVEAETGARLELSLIRAQLLPPGSTVERAALAADLIARFPDALAARVATARLALEGGDPAVVRQALEVFVADGGALSWSLRGRWQCANCNHRPGPFSWRCGQCRRWNAMRMETGIEPAPPPPRDRRTVARPARPEGLLGATPDDALPAPTLDPGLTEEELARAGTRRSLLGRVGGWVSGVWRRKR